MQTYNFISFHAMKKKLKIINTLTIDQKERRINEVTPKVWTKNFWGHFIIDTSLLVVLKITLAF